MITMFCATEVVRVVKQSIVSDGVWVRVVFGSCVCGI